MNAQQAHTAVATSALIVGGVFAYRKLVGTATGSKSGSTGSFITGFLFLYVTLSVVAEVAPPLGGMFAWLVAAGDLLTNGKSLVTDVNKGLGAAAAANTTTKGTT